MAIPHATAGEPVDVRPLGVTIASRRTAALFKPGYSPETSARTPR